jgi:hypothetical protein
LFKLITLWWTFSLILGNDYERESRNGETEWQRGREREIMREREWNSNSAIVRMSCGEEGRGKNVVDISFKIVSVVHLVVSRSCTTSQWQIISNYSSGCLFKSREWVEKSDDNHYNNFITISFVYGISRIVIQSKSVVNIGRSAIYIY